MAKKGITVKQAQQISSILDDIPGAFANMAEALEKADVNIQGICRTNSMGETVSYHLVVDKVDAAKKALKALGLNATTEEVLAVHCSDNRPGIIAAAARKLGDAGINMENIYHTSSERGQDAIIYIVVAKESFKKALKVAQDL